MRSITFILLGLLGLVDSASARPDNTIEYSPQARQKIVEWQYLINYLRPQTEVERLESINRFFNQLTFVSDDILWKKEDYWASPTEMLSVGGGDCEDYAIAKFFSLKQTGINESRLRLAYVRSLTLNQAHMVLLVLSENGGSALVLDNLTTDILPVTERNDLVPVYAFNSQNLWMLDRNFGEQWAANASRLDAWKAFRDRGSEFFSDFPANNSAFFRVKP